MVQSVTDPCLWVSSQEWRRWSLREGPCQRLPCARFPSDLNNAPSASCVLVPIPHPSSPWGACFPKSALEEVPSAENSSLPTRSKPSALSPARHLSKHSEVLVCLQSHFSVPGDGTGRSGQCLISFRHTSSGWPRAGCVGWEYFPRRLHCSPE